MRYSIALVALLVVAACDRGPSPTGVEQKQVIKSYSEAGLSCPDWDPFCEPLTAGDKQEINDILDRFTEFTDTDCFQTYVRAKSILNANDGGGIGIAVTKFTYLGVGRTDGMYAVGEFSGTPMEVSINRNSLNGGSPGETFNNFFHESEHSRRHISATNAVGGDWNLGWGNSVSGGEYPVEQRASQCYRPWG